MTNRTTYLFAGSLIAGAMLWRIINWHYMVAPNLEIVTAATILAAVWLPRRFALYVPLMAVMLSDMIIGNSPILIFTWSAWLIMGLATLLLKPLRAKPKLLLLASVGGAVAGSVFFFAYTNFGVWLIGGLYPHTLAGLITSYVMGLPFYRTMILGNVVLVPLAVASSFGLHSLVHSVDTRLAKAQS